MTELEIEPFAAEYLAAVRGMSGAERLHRMAELSEAIWQMLEIKMAQRYPELTLRGRSKKVAEALYRGDPHALALLAKTNV